MTSFTRKLRETSASVIWKCYKSAAVATFSTFENIKLVSANLSFIFALTSEYLKKDCPLFVFLNDDFNHV